MQHNTIITLEHSKKRLDKALSEIYPEISRSMIAKLCEEGFVLINGIKADKKVILKENII